MCVAQAFLDVSNGGRAALGRLLVLVRLRLSLGLGVGGVQLLLVHNASQVKDLKGRGHVVVVVVIFVVALVAVFVFVGPLKVLVALKAKEGLLVLDGVGGRVLDLGLSRLAVLGLGVAVGGFCLFRWLGLGRLGGLVAEDVALALADLEEGAAVEEEDLGVVGAHLAVHLGLHLGGLGVDLGGFVKLLVGEEGGGLGRQVGERHLEALRHLLGIEVHGRRGARGGSGGRHGVWRAVGESAEVVVEWRRWLLFDGGWWKALEMGGRNWGCEVWSLVFKQRKLETWVTRQGHQPTARASDWLNWEAGA